MVIRIEIVPDTCIGAGQCVLAAPDVFDQRDEDGVVIVLDENPPSSAAPLVLSAAKRCPVRAIEVHEA